MRKLFFVFCLGYFMVGQVRASDLNVDLSDPLFFVQYQALLSQTDLSYSDDIIRLGQKFTYGINNRFSMYGDISLQNDFVKSRDWDGFSSFDIGGVYRLSESIENQNRIVSDVLAGLKFGGSSRVRMPDYADSTYYVGIRFGRQWDRFTLATSVKSSWIFDDVRGMAFIDFEPVAYFRLDYDFRMGLGGMIRKATTPSYNQEWLNSQLIKQYGRTQYSGHIGYEFEQDVLKIGFGINILF